MAATLLPSGRWYTTRDAVKRAIMDATSVTDKDDRIDEAIADASEFIEDYTGRRFIPWTGTKEFDYHAPGLLILGDDLLSVTSITYNDGGNTVASSDYFLYPLNAADDNKPYTKIELLLTDDQFYYSDTRQSDIAVNGKWGYSEITKSIATLNDGDGINTTDTTLAIDGISVTPEIGMTLLMGTEQMFVENYSSPNITVERAVNGTTAASHSDDADIKAIFPPARVRRAANALVARAVARGDSAYSDRVGSAEVGFTYMKAMPVEVRNVLQRLQRLDRLGRIL